jgi:hypothetical protein
MTSDGIRLMPQWSGHPPSELESSNVNLQFIFMVQFMRRLTCKPHWGNLSEQYKKKNRMTTYSKIKGACIRIQTSKPTKKSNKSKGIKQSEVQNEMKTEIERKATQIGWRNH